MAAPGAVDAEAQLAAAFAAQPVLRVDERRRGLPLATRVAALKCHGPGHPVGAHPWKCGVLGARAP
eukprot:7734940-Alexandrium_andersonii.AAC.1